MKKIIVIGGGAAGAKAASKAKRMNPENIVQLYTNDDIIAFSLCGLPYFIEGIVDDVNKLIVRTPEDFFNMGIEVFLNHNLEEIYPNDKAVKINGNKYIYDKLILALGALVSIPKIENVNAKNVFTLHKIKSGIEIKAKMQISKSVLIIGGGYIGIELVEAFIANGLDVTLVEINERVAHDFDNDMSELIQDILDKKSQNRLKCCCGEKIVKFNLFDDGSFKSAVTEDGKEFFADFCILSTGTHPNVEVAKLAGIKLGVTGAIQTDTKMRTNYEDIYAIGDCSEEHSLITRLPIYIGLGSIANKEGRVAGINAGGTGECENFDGILGSVITRYFDYTISKTGLSFKEAYRLSDTISIEPIEATVKKTDKASYMPMSGEISLKLVADKRSGELLGAQAVGCQSNVAQRINTISAALKKRATVIDILHLDLPYAPPFSGSIDPILTACYKLKDMIQK